MIKDELDDLAAKPERKECAGYRTSGHSKGWPCGAIPKHKHSNGGWYCKNHLPLTNEEKEHTNG